MPTNKPHFSIVMDEELLKIVEALQAEYGIKSRGKVMPQVWQVCCRTEVLRCFAAQSGQQEPVGSPSYSCPQYLQRRRISVASFQSRPKASGDARRLRV